MDHQQEEESIFQLEKSSMTVKDSGNTLTIKINGNDPREITLVGHAPATPVFMNLLPQVDRDGGDGGNEHNVNNKQSILFVDRLFGKLSPEARAQVMMYKQIYDSSNVTSAEV